ncbi:MAG: pilus assembly protein PilM [Phycisphaerales bacterium]|nr:MAG: pilus assembly protein PilM [Phycisphaerales bacterium]
MSGKSRTGKILAIDWDVRTLRVVHASVGKRGVKIERVLSVAIPQGLETRDPDLMGKHIRRALDQEDIGTRRAIVDIPRDQATLNTLVLPSTAPEELPGMVAIQIAKELPFAVADAVVDFVAGESDEGGVTAPVHVAAVRREVLEQYQATFAAAGLRLERVGLRPYANKVAVCERLRHAIPERTMFIDVRPALTEIDVLKQRDLAFSRAASVLIPYGVGEPRRLSIVQDETDADEGGVTVEARPPGPGGELDKVVNALVLEVTRSIEAYRATEPGAQIDHVVVGGDLGVEEALAEEIQKRLKVTTEIYNPASTFGWEPDEGAAASAFAATLGLVLSQTDDLSAHFDFLHPKKAVSTTEERLKKAPLVAAVVVLFLAAGAVGLAEMTKPDRKALAEMEKNIAKLREEAGDNKKFVSRVEEIREFDERLLVWVDVLYDAMSALPSNEEMILTHMEMNQKDRRVVFKTKCKEREKATEVVEQLNAFIRPGADTVRFRASMGPQAEKAKDLYPFSQTLRIEVLNDGVG